MAQNNLQSKLQSIVPLQEKAAQERVRKLNALRDGESLITSEKELMCDQFAGFLPEKEREKPEFVTPLSKRWPLDNKIKPVISTRSAFAPIVPESFESIRERWCS